MAKATVISYSFFRIKIGDGNSPEQFSAPCGLNTRAFNRLKNVSEIDVPDCTDEDAPAAVAREVRSTDWNISGEGVLAAESVEVWEAAYDTISPINVLIEMEFPNSPPGLIRKVGAAHLTAYNVTGNRGEKVTCSIELQADGALTPYTG
jgi:hypothetical protein